MLTVNFVGVVRSGGVNSRVLVQGEDGLFYVWRVPEERVSGLRQEGSFQAPAVELEMATEQQVFIGRANWGVVSVGRVAVRVVGVIRRGKKNLRALVVEPGVEGYKTAILPVDGLSEEGGLARVDRRLVFEAREDQVAAGLGVGKLKRGSKRKVPAVGS
jgi:hypothetical protein